MIIRFSVVNKSGVEAYFYAPKESIEGSYDSQIVSGFLQALQITSEMFGSPVQMIKFTNMFLYIRTYGDFTLRLLIAEGTEKQKIDFLLDTLAKNVIKIYLNHPNNPFIPKDLFVTNVKPILDEFESKTIIKGPSIEKLPSEEYLSKIGIVGLSKAGKTSIKSHFFNNKSFQNIKELKPTVGLKMSHEFHQFIQHKFLVLDFGGQVTFRKQHLQQIDIWKDFSCIIFVVDIQDQDSFQEGMQYLQNIWDIIAEVSTRKPKLSIFFHKYDPEKRSILDENMRLCLETFAGFINHATYFLTSIMDSSAVLGVIKTIYLSTPIAIIKRIFEEEVIDRFNHEFLVEFANWRENDRFKGVVLEERQEIFTRAKEFGFSLSKEVERAWVAGLMDTWVPKERRISSKSIQVNQRGQFLVLSTPTWKDEDYPIELILILLKGILTGVTTTLQLSPPKIVQQNSYSILWEIEV